jgi:starch-binding outer membrane protein, SusD/RagB family
MLTSKNKIEMNMKNINIKLLAGLFVATAALTSCTDDLDQSDPSSANLPTVDELYSDPEAYKATLAKLYAGFATTGQQGPAGAPDISGIDEGFSQYIRGLWYLQELTTDEAVIGWNDQTIKDFHYQTWSSNDNFINATWSRLDFEIKNCNEYLRQTSDEKLDARGVSSELREQIAVYRAEARFLRAVSYWHFLDFFGGRVGLVTENDPTTYFLPEQATAQEIFTFIETELTEIDSQLMAPRTNEYPRIDQAAAWMLKAKLYMNAEVYLGTSMYAEAMPLLTNVISAGYALHDDYDELFMADNDTNGAQDEFIFAVAFDGIKTQTYGGTTFLVHAPIGGSMNAANYGVNGGWGGVRTTSAFVGKFPSTTDDRYNFHTDGQSLTITDISTFTDGYAIGKWSNLTSTGVQGNDAAGDFADTDFPIFRLADAYLMYAECALRTGNDAGTALTYVNLVRQRSNAASVSAITVDDVLDERARELYWEGHRRTDLIRFNKFTGGSYLWAWKGNTPNGSPTPSYRKIFPIPANAIAANPLLQQNTGY